MNEVSMNSDIVTMKATIRTCNSTDIRVVVTGDQVELLIFTEFGPAGCGMDFRDAAALRDLLGIAYRRAADHHA